MKILMVCLGNICRSPLAEGILAHKTQHLSIEIDSAGTAGYHIGKLPDERSIEIAEKYKSEEVVFLAFAMNEKPKIESFLKKHTFDYTILPDSGTVIGDYKIKSYPAHIILDQNSKIGFSIRGLSNSTASEIDEAIEGLIEK